ncbi:hypothetical protein LCM4577_33130 [Mesorhizobium sp. LCM 4577]|nr:hypothetical protein LCM4577_33130 [Mesorhizobium sp. LCM 4577]
MQPLFEAVSNSIHSTQDRFKDNVATQGKIIVTLTMASRQAPSKIVVEDNGVGLDGRNYDAFTTTDTDNKIARRAIARIARPAAIPREISSRSASPSAEAALRLAEGAMPPCKDTIR